MLYESVIDPDAAQARRVLHTPDWLAERVVCEIVDDPLHQRVLDPACGSGTFLFWAIRRHLSAADASGMSNREAVNSVLSSVFGIDLHPVAVTLARVTYILALGSVRLRDRDPIAVPVYLGDSIHVNQSTTVLSAAGMTIHTTDGLELFDRELNFPESLVADAGRFDRLVGELADKAATRLSKGQAPAIDQTLTNHGVTAPADRAVVEKSYRTLCDLHRPP